MLCKCDCGNVRTAKIHTLRTGGIKSCGCYHPHPGPVKHGCARTKNQTKEYRCWFAAKKRTTDPKNKSFRNYGALGVSMCEKWIASFPAFLADVGEAPTPEHTIDRINPYGNYEPSNCRWATRKQQARNKTNTVITEKIADKIRIMKSKGMQISLISKELNIAKSTAGNVFYGKGWLP